MIIIRTNNLTKKFKQLVAVSDVSIDVEEGECLGLLGPNGAGKTSLIRMITAVSPPTEGSISILDKDLLSCPRELKAIMGVVPQLDNLDSDFTVLQNLVTFSRYFDIPKSEAYRRSMEVLTLFELQNRYNSKINELSGGMKRRLLIARGLINLPKIFILDEPTIGLDPQAKYLVWNKLTELKSQGVTQLICTQNMEEAAFLCNRVAIMHKGKILSLDTPQSTIDRYVGKNIIEIDIQTDTRELIIKELEYRRLEFEEVGSKIHIFHAKMDDSFNEIIINEQSLTYRRATLEDVFFRLTGRTLTE